MIFLVIYGMERDDGNAECKLFEHGGFPSICQWLRCKLFMLSSCESLTVMFIFKDCLWRTTILVSFLAAVFQEPKRGACFFLDTFIADVFAVY